ncbi:hypothetical protein [Aeromonas salmonicida]|uniref:hypothetical protein n=1 Tax=Aeromonas salmonicida TaxID=645 RepID=UPI003D24505C
MSIFSLENYQHLLQKCQCEYKLLKGCESHPEYDFLLFNLVVSLNHLFDWFLKENSISEHTKSKCIIKFNPFISLDDIPSDFKGYYKKLNAFPPLNEFQEVIRKLCNKAKHFKKKTIESQGKNYTCGAGDDSVECGNPEIVCGTFNHYLYFVEISGEDINLEALISKHLIDWECFLNDIKLGD